MSCSILRLYVSEEESTYSVEEKNPTIKVVKKQKKSTKLSTGSRWLFEKLRYLSKKDGYFYGSNTYLANQFSVDTRTIQRWLECLKIHGMIKVDLTKKNGFDTSRNIYIISNNFYTRQDCRPRHDRIAVQNESSKEENMNDSEALQSSSLFLEHKKAKASPKLDHEKLYEFIHKDKLYPWEFKLCKNSLARWNNTYFSKFILDSLADIIIRYKDREEKEIHKLMEKSLQENWVRAPESARMRLK